MNIPTNPALPGPFQFGQVVYAAPNLDYGTNSDLAPYRVYEHPDAAFITRTIDLSLFAELGFGISWPFDNQAVPLNGFAVIPQGAGPFPLALFAHGNHNPLEHSTPGYLYLCKLLASHGVIAATIDVNFLNGNNFGENDGRAIIHLEHIRQFLLWNQQGGHPLEGKIDPERVMIVGHSRGGEAVGHASLFKHRGQVQPDTSTPPVLLDGSRGFGPYNFALRAVAAIAPTDSQWRPVDRATQVQTNYFIIHGSRDGDVRDFQGYRTYDRTHAVDLNAPTVDAAGFKALLWVQGANHNYFNSVWAQESQNTISRADQERIASVYLSALAQALLLDRIAYMELFRDLSFGPQTGWLPTTARYVTQYQAPSRIFIQHSEEPQSTPSVSVPFLGSVSTTATAGKISFNLGANTHLYQETKGVRLRWNQNGRNYRVNLSTVPTLAPFEAFAFRIGQSPEPDNPSRANQDFTLEFVAGGQSMNIRASSIRPLIYPDIAIGANRKTVMQTLRVPFDTLRGAGLDPMQLSSVALLLDRTPRGVLYLDDLQVTE